MLPALNVAFRTSGGQDTRVVQAAEMSGDPCTNCSAFPTSDQVFLVSQVAAKLGTKHPGFWKW